MTTKSFSMINMSHRLTSRLGILITAALIGGCETAVQERQVDIDETRKTMQALAEKHRPAVNTSLQSARRIEVDEDSAWLFNHYRATYTNRKLKDALKKIVPGFPITYALDPNYNPVVSSSPQSVTIEDHLNNITLQANVGYLFHDGALIITPTVTREYTIPIFGGATSNVAVGSNNLGTDTVQAGNFANTLSNQLNAGSDLSNLVTATLGLPFCAGNNPTQVPGQLATFTGNTNECFSINLSSNLLSITARPQRLVLFERAYKKWFRDVTRQANVKMTVIRMDVTDLAQQRFDFSLIRNASISGGLQNLTADITSSTLVDAGAVLGIQITDTGSAWNTSQIILEALDAIANVAIHDQRELLLHNNRLVTLRNFSIERFVEKITIQQTNTGGTSLDTPTVEIGELEVGQAINILPTLTDDAITLHIVINEGEVDSYDVYNVAGTTGVLPQNSGTDTVFDVTLKHNEAVLLASTTREEVDLNEDRSGALPVWPLNRLKNASEGRKRMIQTLYLIEGSFRS